MTTARSIISAVLLAAAWQCNNHSAHAQLAPLDVGTTVPGYQDDFDGAALAAGWTVRGSAVYSVSGGMLHIATASGDPNHLLYEIAGYDNTVQEVLVRIRVTNFTQSSCVTKRI